MNVPAAICVLTAAMLFSSGLVVAQTDAPRVERPVWPPAGSTWTVQTKSTGSLGSTGANIAGSSTATWEALGEQDWEGRRVMGLTPGGGFYLYYDVNRRIVAQVRDGKPVQTYDPYEALYDWPLFVGKSWVSEFRIRDHSREQTVSLKYDFRVEAAEEVSTPAGVFKTFRIRRDGPNDRYIVWFSPELAVEVKRVWERFSSHRLGPGTNEMELLSHNIKK
jgi:hypothetical protein